MAPPILTLPAEVVDNIARQLPRKDLASFRHTCHDLEAKSFKCFSTTFTFTLSRSGIAKLEALSLSPLAAHVGKIEFRYASDRKTWPNSYPERFQGYNHLSALHRAASAAYYLDLEKYINEWASSKLRRILKSFSSLTSVSIEASYYMREISNGPHEACIPMTGLFNDPESEYKNYHSDTTASVLAAVYDSGIRLQSLHIHNREARRGDLLSDAIKVKQDDMHRFKDVASSLQNLTLTGWPDCPDNNLEMFLSSMSGLRTLCLDINYRKGEYFTRLLKGSFFPHLKELQLNSCDVISEDDLFSFVSRHGETLRRLEIFHIELSDDGSSSWSSFFHRLRTSSLQLEYLNVENVVHFSKNVDLRKENLLDLAAVVETMDTFQEDEEIKNGSYRPPTPPWIQKQ